MTTEPPVPPASYMLNSLVGMQYEMPPTLEAYYDLYAHSYLKYAHAVLRNKDDAKLVVRRLFENLALNWDRALRAESVEAHVWRLLKEGVETHLALTGVHRENARTTSVQQAARVLLDDVRERMRRWDSPLGLYTAIADLPDRQFDVIVLSFVLGYPSPRIASIMGIQQDTVRAHRRTAVKRIAARIRPLLKSTDNEKE
ncbi:RNA polymerase sigma factor [Streptomyces albidoflavus]